MRHCQTIKNKAGANKTKLERAYGAVLKEFTIEPSLLLTIIDDDSLSIDWNELEKNLEKGLEKQSIESRKSYLLCLIKINRFHSKNLAAEIDYSERILAFDQIPEDIFTRLEEYYSKQKTTIA